MTPLRFTDLIWCLFLSVVFISLSIYFSYLSDNNKNKRIVYGITSSFSNVTGFIGAVIIIFIFVIRILPERVVNDLRLASEI